MGTCTWWCSQFEAAPNNASANANADDTNDNANDNAITANACIVNPNAPPHRIVSSCSEPFDANANYTSYAA